MTAPMSSPTPEGDAARTGYRTKDARNRPLALTWREPDSADPDQADTPALQNGWAQPSPGAGPTGNDLEPFAFRLHNDGSLEFKGHLDSAGASTETVALTLPGANPGEPNYLFGNDQFFDTVIYDGSTPQKALVYIDKTTGDVTITFPFS